MFLKKTPVVVNPIFQHPDENRLSLDGTWSVRLDEKDEGLQQHWYKHTNLFPDRAQVPGCLQGQGIGYAEMDELIDYHLFVRVNRATYSGIAWYGKTFELPETWNGKRIWLNFGGACPTAQVWVNGQVAGENHYPFIPFGFDVTDAVHPGLNHVAVRISEEDRELAFAFNFVGKWSGLYRSVELTAVRGTAIDEIQIRPEVDTGRITFRLKPLDYGDASGDCSLSVRISEDHGDVEVFRENYPLDSLDLAGGYRCFTVRMDRHRDWSPEDPFLYRFGFILQDAAGVCDARIERNGFVKIAASGKKILINSYPYFMRGGDEWMRCTTTVCPDTSRDIWRKGLGRIRSFGYNYIRCQSTLPNPEYMDAADETGLIIQSELGMLGAISGNGAMHAYAWPQPNAEFYHKLLEQWLLGVRRDVNRPSCQFYSMSNELAANLNRTEYPRIAWKCYRETKAIKPGAMIIWTDGGYNENLPSDFVNDQAELDAKTEKPVIQHEYQWWTSYPDIRIAWKYNGGGRPFAQEIAFGAAFRHGIGHLLPDFADVSQHLQFIEAKGKMERCRRDNPTLAGIDHFSTKDTGSSPQGMIDEFYDKKLIDAAEWLKTNGDTVILSSLEFKTRCFEGGGLFESRLFVSDFSHPPFETAKLSYRLKSRHSIIEEGTLSYEHKPYTRCDAGLISIALPETTKPAEMVLEAFLDDGVRKVTNDWKIWVFPTGRNHWDASVQVATRQMADWFTSLSGCATSFQGRFDGTQVLLADYIDENILEFIRKGGRVLLAAGEGLKRAFQQKWSFGEGRYYFSNAACYPFLEDGQHGMLIRPHPMFGDFPAEKHADLQFYRMIAEAAPMDIEHLGLNDEEPVMRMIHNYQVARPLADMLERKHGDGLLVMTSLDLNQDYPEARSLLGNIVHYLQQSCEWNCASLKGLTIEKLLQAARINE